jgi:membrane-bound serine protease (ClpP class)
VAGVVLLALEVFVTPGFGVAGVLGIGALLAGLIMSMTGGGATAEFILKVSGRVVSSLVFALLASFVLLRFLPRLPLARKLVLETGLDTRDGYASAPESDHRWLGKTGHATSPLRPAGIAQFEGERVDVVSDGEHIEPGESIEVIRVDGNRIVVRRVPAENQGR